MYLNNVNRERNVAIYARVSTEHEAQLYALENQKEWYNSVLENHPEWNVVKMYVDEGVTGTSATKRPQFLQMIKDAETSEFDLILTREVSRFARNTVDTLQYTRFLKSKKVEVYFINDNIKTFDGDGELRLTIMATLAQDESRKTSIRVKSGQQTSMNNGVFYGNGNILGYDRVGSMMVINPEQAETVRMIFDMYLEGMGLRAIQIKLEQLGRLTATGKTNWHCACLSKILSNTFYYGVITYHKEFVPDFLEQKKILNHGDIEITQTKGSHEPIITEEEFNAVQRIKNQRRGEIPNLCIGRLNKNGRPPKSIWSHLMICSCGNRFNKRTWHKDRDRKQYAYQCYSSKVTGTVSYRAGKGLSTDGICDTPMVPEWKMQMMARYIASDIVSNSDEIINCAMELLNKHLDKPKISIDDKLIENKKSELSKLKSRLNNYIEMRADGEITKDTFLIKQSELNDKIEELEKYIEDNDKTEEIKYDIPITERISLLKNYLQESLKINPNEDVPEYILKAFVDKIVVNKESFDWYLRFKDDSISLKVDGKTKKNGKVSIPSYTQHRQLLTWEGNYYKILSLNIGKSYARTFLHLYSTNSKLQKWNDLHINVYI